LTIIRQGWLWAAFAISAYYPLINLGATAGFGSGSITTLLQGPGVLWSFGPSVVATILISVGGARSPIRRTERFHLGTVPIKNNKAITRFGQSCRNARTHIAETDETELAASEFVSRGLLISQSDLSKSPFTASKSISLANRVTSTAGPKRTPSKSRTGVLISELS
jgi:hypothetical protein